MITMRSICFYLCCSPHKSVIARHHTRQVTWILHQAQPPQHEGSPALLVLLVLVSVVGNFLVCLAVKTDKTLRKLSNLFLVSLALADLFVRDSRLIS